MASGHRRRGPVDDVQLRTVTKDRNVFKTALADVQVHGGDDCPEYALTGIETALNNSLPLSYLYVFTDASAKDYEKLDEIRSIALRKQSQVVFILTGRCGSTSDDDYQVYYELAQATGGQVFNVLKEDVKDITKYIEESSTVRRVLVVNSKFPAGTHKVKVKKLRISTPGDYELEIEGSDEVHIIIAKSDIHVF